MSDVNQTAQNATMERVHVAGLEIEMLRMANAQNVSLEQIKASLAQSAMKERGKKELFAAEQRLKLVAGSGI